MDYIKLTDDLYVECDVDNKKSNIISRGAIEYEIALNQQQIDLLPVSLSDAQLLSWAKENYIDANQRNREVLQQSIDELTQKLSDIDGKFVDASVQLSQQHQVI